MLLFSYSLEKILEAITAAAEEKNVDRFSPIVEGLQDNSVQLQVRNLFCTNSLCNKSKINLHIFLFWGREGGEGGERWFQMRVKFCSFLKI